MSVTARGIMPHGTCYRACNPPYAGTHSYITMLCLDASLSDDRVTLPPRLDGLHLGHELQATSADSRLRPPEGHSFVFMYVFSNDRLPYHLTWWHCFQKVLFGWSGLVACGGDIDDIRPPACVLEVLETPTPGLVPVSTLIPTRSELATLHPLLDGARFELYLHHSMRPPLAHMSSPMGGSIHCQRRAYVGHEAYTMLELGVSIHDVCFARDGSFAPLKTTLLSNVFMLGIGCEDEFDTLCDQDMADAVHISFTDLATGTVADLEPGMLTKAKVSNDVMSIASLRMHANCCFVIPMHAILATLRHEPVSMDVKSLPWVGCTADMWLAAHTNCPREGIAVSADVTSRRGSSLRVTCAVCTVDPIVYI
jgi:hypothetical protein